MHVMTRTAFELMANQHTVINGPAAQRRNRPYGRIMKPAVRCRQCRVISKRNRVVVGKVGAEFGAPAYKRCTGPAAESIQTYGPVMAAKASLGRCVRLS